MAPHRIALIGAGLIGREHVTLIAANPNAELVAISDVSDESVHYASAIGIRHFLDFEAMLDDVKPDGVIIASPNALHVKAALACVERNIACLVEKPISDTLESAIALVRASESSGVPVLVGHQRRHSPDIQKSRQLLAEGTIGRLVAVHGMWLTDKPEHYFNVDWRRRAGGGPLLINLIHDIDCLRYICGDIHSVQAFTSNAVRAFEVEDTASIALRFENGALGSFLMSDTVVSPFNWDTAAGQALYFPHQPENTYYFGGTKGCLTAPGMDLWRHENPDGNWQDPLLRQHVSLDGSRAYVNQLDHFLSVIRREVEPLVSARDGMMTLATVLAIQTAGAENRTVSIAEFVEQVKT